jgi:hypothetical protein
VFAKCDVHRFNIICARHLPKRYRVRQRFPFHAENEDKMQPLRLFRRWRSTQCQNVSRTKMSWSYEKDHQNAQQATIPIAIKLVSAVHAEKGYALALTRSKRLVRYCDRTCRIAVFQEERAALPPTQRGLPLSLGHSLANAARLRRCLRGMPIT